MSCLFAFNPWSLDWCNFELPSRQKNIFKYNVLKITFVALENFLFKRGHPQEQKKTKVHLVCLYMDTWRDLDVPISVSDILIIGTDMNVQTSPVFVVKNKKRRRVDR